MTDTSGGRARRSRRTPLVLPLAVRRAILSHARAEHPLECCGLLVGCRGIVTAALPSANLARSGVRYELDPRTHIDARRVLRRLRPPLEILGVYHSHPAGEASPSPADIAEAQYAEWVYLIVGRSHGRLRLAGFRIRRRQVEAVEILARRPRAVGARR